jgi:hypothetical protein
MCNPSRRLRTTAGSYAVELFDRMVIINEGHLCQPWPATWHTGTIAA